MARFFVFGASDDDPGTAAIYAYLGQAANVSWTTTEVRREIPLTDAVDVTEFTVTVAVAPGGVTTRTYTLRKNGVDTAVTVTLTGTDVTQTWTGLVSFAAGDRITLKETGTGAPAAPGVTTWTTEMRTVGNTVLLMGGAANVVSNTATNYGNPFGQTAWVAASGDNDIVVPTGATITKARYQASALPGAAKTYDLSLRHNNSTDNLTGQITNASTAATATGSLTVAAGDTLQLKSVPTLAPTAVAFAWCFTYTPAAVGEAFYGFGIGTALSTTTVQYNQPLGTGGGFSSAEANKQHRTRAVSIKKLFVRYSAAPGGATKTRTVTVRKNSAASALTATATNAQTTASDTTNTVTMAASDLFGFQFGLANTPAAADVHVGYVIVTDQTQTISGAGGNASSVAIGSATVARGAVTVAPTGVASVAAFGSPTLTALATLATTGIASSMAFGTATVTAAAGGATLAPAGLASSATLGAATVAATYAINIGGASTYAALVAALTPAAYYRLADRSDSSGNGNTLTDGGSAPTFEGAATLIDGTADNGMTLSSTGRYENSPVVVGSGSDPFTVCGWCELTTDASPGARIAAATAIAGTDCRWFILLDGDGGIYAFRGFGGTARQTAPAPIPGMNANGTTGRVFVALRHTGSVMHLYVNGVEVGSVSDAGATGTNTGATLGGSGGSAIGHYDEFALFASDIGATNIAALYAEGSRAITSQRSVGTPGDIERNVTPTAIASSAATSSPTVTPGAVSVVPAGVASTAAAGSATVTNGNTIAASGVPSTATVNGPTVTPIAFVAPSTVTSTSAIGDAAVAGSNAVMPSGLASTSAPGAPTITSLALVTPTGATSTAALGDATVSSSAQIAPGGIASNSTLGAHTVSSSTPAITPAGIASTAATGSATVITITYVVPAGIASTAAAGSANVTTAAAVGPSGIATASTVPSPLVVRIVTATSVASAAAFGTANVSRFGDIAPAGIASNAAIGAPLVTSIALVFPEAIVRSTQVGTAVVHRRPSNLENTGTVTVTIETGGRVVGGVSVAGKVTAGVENR